MLYTYSYNNNNKTERKYVSDPNAKDSTHSLDPLL